MIWVECRYQIFIFANFHFHPIYMNSFTILHNNHESLSDKANCIVENRQKLSSQCTSSISCTFNNKLLKTFIIQIVDVDIIGFKVIVIITPKYVQIADWELYILLFA